MDKNTKLIKEVLIELANTVPLLGIGLFAIGINQLIKK